MKYFVKKRIFAVVFLLAMFAFSAVNIYTNKDAFIKATEKYEKDARDGVLKQKAKELDENGKEKGPDTLPKRYEKVMQDGIYAKTEFVETYGFAQKSLGKKEFNAFEFVKDNNGFLHYASFYRDEEKNIFDFALRVKKLQNYVEKYGTKVLFVMAPSKYSRQYSDFSIGMPVNNPTEDTYEMMLYLNRLGVPSINLGEVVPSKDIPYDQAFFKTDHHWTVPAAFEATKVMIDELNDRYGANFDPTGFYLSDKAYKKEVYKGHMLGSMGRDTGIAYSGLEDFTALLPTFDGHYKRTYIMDDEETLEGTYSETLLDMDVLKPDIDYYVDSQYSLYVDQVTNLENIENLDNPDGPSVLMIRDSYFGPIIPFMAPMCSKIDAIWSLEKMDGMNVGEYIKKQYESGEKYDYLIVEYYPHNIDEEAFKFFRGDN